MMSTKTATEAGVLRELGDGLVMRRATATDAKALADYNAIAHSWSDEPSEFMRAWTEELMSGRHPKVGPSDFTVVEDTGTSKIVSSLNLISQKWTYAGVEFGVGQVELVSTHPDYRNHGLVRAQFEQVHEWSRERGEQATVVVGIPWFYRQFGYELALESYGGRAGYEANIPHLKEGESEPYQLRPAIEGDIRTIAKLYEAASGRYLVYNAMDDTFWRYLLFERKDRKGGVWWIVETPGGEPMGFLSHGKELHGAGIHAGGYELEPGESWASVTPTVLRHLHKTGLEYAARDEGTSFKEFSLRLGPAHPAYAVSKNRLPREVRSSVWYVRVPDVPGFLRHVSRVLEERLSDSFAARHTGELKISFATEGVRLSFESGRLTASEPWGPTKENGWDDSGRNALFPDLTWLHLLFGHRSVDDLEYAFADCEGGSGETRALLDVLFPKLPSMARSIA